MIPCQPGALAPVLQRPLILASQSPRRRELLQAAGLTFTVRVPAIDESPRSKEGPEQLVRRLAAAKAAAVSQSAPAALVIGADTIVVLAGEILGKPADEAEAQAMLLRLQGREHLVWGGVALYCAAAAMAWVEAYVTRVSMIALTPAQAAAYAASGEPRDKAGSYAIQGLGAQLIESLEGSYTNVVGLNLAAVRRLLERAGDHDGRSA